MVCALKISLYHNGPQHLQNESKFTDLVMRIVNLGNFIATTLRFSEKFDHPFSQVFGFESRFRCYDGHNLYQRYKFQFIPL